MVFGRGEQDIGSSIAVDIRHRDTDQVRPVRRMVPDHVAALVVPGDDDT